MSFDIEFKKSAIKDIKDLPLNYKDKVIRFLFSELPKISSLSEIPDMKKIKGYD